MKAIIVGCGQMGRVIGCDLIKTMEFDELLLIDSSNEALLDAYTYIKDFSDKLYDQTDELNYPKIKQQKFILKTESDFTALKNHLFFSNNKYDVLISAADYSINCELTKLCIDLGINMCDLGGNNNVVKDQLSLNQKAAQKGIVIIPDCGLAPGMANYVALHIYKEFQRKFNQKPESIKIRVGGLPQNPEPPFNYKLVFSAKGLINEYVEPSVIVKNNKVQTVESLTDVEDIYFNLKRGAGHSTKMEAFNTSGGLSDLFEHVSVNNLDYKTVRYAGHCNIFAAFKKLGLLNDAIIRKAIEISVTQNLTNNDKDLVVVRIAAEKFPYRIQYELIDFHDDITGHSAMARTTGYSAGAVAYLLAKGECKKYWGGGGVSTIALPLNRFIQEIEFRGLNFEVSERPEF